MHALVTGGGGFLGRYIVEALLARGDRVRSFGRGAYPKLEAAGVEVVRGDLRDSVALGAACVGIDCVFHTAALPGIGLDRDEFEAVNQRGTESLLSAARFCGVKSFVYTSSPSVVFAGVDQRGVDESAPYDFGWMDANRAFYSYTKACAEQAVLSANDDEFRTCALRPHLIWGPRDTHLIPRLIARAEAGRLRRVGDGTNLVDITYVENAAAAHLQVADALVDVQHGSPDPAETADREVSTEAGRTTVKEGAGSGDPRTIVGDPRAAGKRSESSSTPAGKAYFISQGEAVNCWEWISDVLALAGLPPVKRAVSRRTAEWIGGKCESIYRTLRIGSEPPMTRFLAAQLSTSHWFDISAARRDFGYAPRISTAEGMQRLREWLRDGQ
jgi:2-alkyl-3-oxoalkanoate reductase